MSIHILSHSSFASRIINIKKPFTCCYLHILITCTYELHYCHNILLCSILHNRELHLHSSSQLNTHESKSRSSYDLEGGNVVSQHTLNMTIPCQLPMSTSLVMVKIKSSMKNMVVLHAIPTFPRSIHCIHTSRRYM